VTLNALTDRDKHLLEVMTVISFVMGINSFLFEIMRSRSGIAAQRAYTQDGKYLVNVRYSGQWYDIRDFVQPSDPDVITVFKQYGPDYWALFDFVCRHVSYRLDIGEFFQFPPETLDRQLGDCEDSANLLTSLLRNSRDIPAYSVLGAYCGYGHAWCYTQGQILETTFTRAMTTIDPQNYYPYVYYDEQGVVELWPGALSELFSLRRDETRKLKIMAKVMAGYG